MKSKTKFLWFYTVILFSVALMLILFAGMTQQDYEKEIETHETAAVGMKKSVTELTEVNAGLRSQVEELQADVEELKASQADYDAVSASNTLNDTLIKALYQFESKDKDGAEELLGEIDSATLTPEQLAIYDKIMN